MILLKNGDTTFPIDDNQEEDLDVDEFDDEDAEEKETEDIQELEEIESKMEKGEEVTMSALETTIISKSRLIYFCPRCHRIFFSKKWVKDIITDIFSVHTELAYCPKCVGKTYDNFVGSVEIFDKKLKERKDKFIEVARQIERSLEDAPPFENIIEIVEKNKILFMFVNTTRLALEIGKLLRQEFGGGIQYEWFERNQFLRVKWYDDIADRAYFEEGIRILRNRRFGMFSFEDGG